MPYQQSRISAHEKQLIRQFLNRMRNGVTNPSEYFIIENIIKRGEFKTYVEVGVAFGDHLRHQLEHTDISTVYGIDPYLHYPIGYYDHLNMPQTYMDVFYEDTFFFLKSFIADHRLVLLRKDSIVAASLFNEESIDIVLLDGNHTYEAITKDIKAWWPKIAPNGVLVGDDFLLFDSVRQAVFDAQNYLNVPVYSIGNKWIACKNPEHVFNILHDL